MALSRPLNHEPSPAIFKLNVDCFDEIFEYLSLDDLYSIAQTCKSLQKVAGLYFQQNYKDPEFNFGLYDYMYFRQYIDCVACGNLFSEAFASYSTEFTSAYYLYLDGGNFNILKSENIQKTLSKIEVLQLSCMVLEQQDFYGILLGICKNLKRFILSASFKEMNREWLHQNYPKLEHIDLVSKDIDQMDEIITFLELNPQIKSFSITADWIWKYKTNLLQMNVKLDELKIKQFYRVTDERNWQEFFDLLNQLFERGFYKKFHFYYDMKMKESLSKILPLVKGLENLIISDLECEFNQMNNLNDLAITSCYDYGSYSNDLPNKLLNIEKIFLCNISHKEILPFIRQSWNLTKIKLEFFKDDTIDLVYLNEERGKLCDAKKLTIYVDNKIFLDTKWTTPNGKTDLKFVELRPTTSYRWNHEYHY